MTDPPQRLLFLCTGNSCRSQMAEGMLREWGGDRFEACSAGSNPAGSVHPLAVQAMKEIGIDISAQTSKSIVDFLPPPPNCEPPDIIISVCDTAAKNCPTFPGNVKRVSWPFDDPADATGSDDDKMSSFRKVRDEIRTAIETRLIERR